MNFGWIKKQIKKIKSLKKITSDLALIDTSFICVPKLSNLNQNDKERVLDFYNKLISKDIDLVKYSSDLLDKANSESEMLVRAMLRYEKEYDYLDYSYKKDVPSFELCHLGKLSSIEYRIIEEDLTSIKKELLLKLVALDMYIKKEERRKYDFFGIFASSERVKYLMDKNKLLSERERLLTSIKILDNILTTIRKDINSNQRLILYYDLLVKLKDDNSTENIRKSLGKTLEELYKKSEYSGHEECTKEIKKEIGYKMIGYPIRKEAQYRGENLLAYTVFFEGDSYDEFLKECYGVINEKLINFVLDKASCGEWTFFISVVPDEFLDKVYEIIARCWHRRDLFIYEHRNDYKKYLYDMKLLIKEYETMPIEKWDVDLFKKQIEFYKQKVSQTIDMYVYSPSFYTSRTSYDDQLSPVMEEQLRNTYKKIFFLYAMKIGYKEINYLSLGWDMETLYKEFFYIMKELYIDVSNKYKTYLNYNKEPDIDYINYYELSDKINRILETCQNLYKVLNGNCKISKHQDEVCIIENGKTKVLSKVL